MLSAYTNYILYIERVDQVSRTHLSPLGAMIATEKVEGMVSKRPMACKR